VPTKTHLNRRGLSINPLENSQSNEYSLKNHLDMHKNNIFAPTSLSHNTHSNRSEAYVPPIKS
jgi:hypothetical protein